MLGDSVDLGVSPMASPQELERSAMIADDVPDSSDEEAYKEDWISGSLEMGRDKQFDGSSETLGPSLARENDAQKSSLRQHLFKFLIYRLKCGCIYRRSTWSSSSWNRKCLQCRH